MSLHQLQQLPHIWSKLAKHRIELNKNILSQLVTLIELILSLQSSHLALIDTLMMAYTVEMVSVERVMSCIGRYTSAEQSHGEGHLQELPYDTEDAIVTWINKVRTAALLCTRWTTRVMPTNILKASTNREHTPLCFSLERWRGVCRRWGLTCLLVNQFEHY